MTKEESAKARAVMEAWENGATIQATYRNGGNGHWSDCHPDSTVWAFDRFDYRVKPVPMEIEVWFTPEGNMVLFPLTHHKSGLTKKRFREIT